VEIDGAYVPLATAAPTLILELGAAMHGRLPTDLRLTAV